MSLATVSGVMSWIRKDIDPNRQSELERCCSAATSFLAALTDRTLERTTKVVYFDGDVALGGGRELWLHPGHRPVLHTGADLVTVESNGSALSVAVGYTTTAGAVLVGANEDRPCRLVRYAGIWPTGIQNIKVTYKCGWQTDRSVVADTQPVPLGVEQLANEIAWLMFVSPSWLGLSNVSHAGAAVSISNDLSPASKRMLDNLIVVVC